MDKIMDEYRRGFKEGIEAVRGFIEDHVCDISEERKLLYVDFSDLVWKDVFEEILERTGYGRD